VQQLTDDLKTITASASDLTVHALQLRWGLRPGELPYLLGCPVFDFVSESHFADLVVDILLCLALEISVVGTPGQCITPERVCIGADRSVLRSKVALYRIRKFFTGAVTGKDLDKLIDYVMEKLRGAIPDLALAHVPCCARCLHMYSTAASSSLAAAPIAADRRESNQWRPQNKLPGGMRAFAQNKRMKSGLLIVQDASTKSCKQAVAIYLADPFPAFFQHSRRE
jgi:hypothetical protein